MSTPETPTPIQTPSKPRGSSGRIAWLLLFVAALGMGYFIAFDRVDHQLTSEIANRLQSQFPNHRINIDRARLIPGESILIDGLTVAKATDRGVRDVLKIGRVTCQGPIDLIGIIQGQVPIDTVILDGLDLSLWPTADNAWSIQELIPRESKPANRIPNIHIRSGLLRIGHPSGYLAREILCHDLQGILTEQSAPSDRSGKIDTEQVLSASLSSSHFSRLAIQAKRYSTT